MPTIATMRKCLCPAPVYEAHFDDNTYARLSFWTPQDKPIDPDGGRRVIEAMTGWTVTHLPTVCRIEAGLLTGKRLVRGYVEHDVPGRPWVRFVDPHFLPHTVAAPTAKRATAKEVKAALANVLAWIDRTGPADALAKAREMIAA